MSTEIPAHVLAGVPAEEIPLRAIPPLSGFVVLTWYEPEKRPYAESDKPKWTAHGPFATEGDARGWIAGCNQRHRAALIVPVEWRAENKVAVNP